MKRRTNLVENRHILHRTHHPILRGLLQMHIPSTFGKGGSFCCMLRSCVHLVWMCFFETTNALHFLSTKSTSQMQIVAQDCPNGQLYLQNNQTNQKLKIGPREVETLTFEAQALMIIDCIFAAEYPSARHALTVQRWAHHSRSLAS